MARSLTTPESAADKSAKDRTEPSPARAVNDPPYVRRTPSSGGVGLFAACILAGLAIAVIAYRSYLTKQLDKELEAQAPALNQSLQEAGFDKETIQHILTVCGSSCPKEINDQAQKRLQQISSEQQRYQEAQNDPDKLRGYVNSCVACNFKSEANLRIQRLDERRRQDDEHTRIAKAEEQSYRAARGDLQKLQTYASSCTICVFKDDANKGIAELRQSQAIEQDSRQDAQTYQQARGNLTLLRNYIQTCVTCTYKSAALQEATKLNDDLQMSMVKVCNRSSRRASVAAMGRISPSSDEWHVQGWWPVPASRCINLRRFVKGTVYLFAQEDGNPSFTWKGNAKRICVALPGPFDRINHDGNDCQSSEKEVPFSSFAISDDSFTWDLNP